MTRRYLVTGVRGFIGGRLAEELSKQGVEVVGMDMEDVPLTNWPNEFEELLAQQSPSAVFHVGADANTLQKDVQYEMFWNYEVSRALGEWCSDADVPLIYSSSAAVTGDRGSMPTNLYAWSKWAAENFLVARGAVALRYFNVYGPGESPKGAMASVIHQAYVAAKNGQTFRLFPGKPRRDFVYVEDVVSANLHALGAYPKVRSGSFDVGSGQARTFEDCLNLMDVPFAYRDVTEIPVGYQAFTCANEDRFLPDWRPAWPLEAGVPHYRSALLDNATD